MMLTIRLANSWGRGAPMQESRSHQEGHTSWQQIQANTKLIVQSGRGVEERPRLVIGRTLLIPIQLTLSLLLTWAASCWLFTQSAPAVAQTAAATAPMAMKPHEGRSSPR